MATGPDPPYRGGTPPKTDILETHVHEARELLNSVGIAADVPKIRNDLIDTLVKAIATTNDLANQSSSATEKGAGGVPPKVRWYQLLGYLVQVLDGVCKNVELSEINERLLRVERKLSVAKSGSPQARRKS